MHLLTQYELYRSNLDIDRFFIHKFERTFRDHFTKTSGKSISTVSATLMTFRLLMHAQNYDWLFTPILSLLFKLKNWKINSLVQTCRTKQKSIWYLLTSFWIHEKKSLWVSTSNLVGQLVVTIQVCIKCLNLNN